ncbi:MAG TPA: M81 family metallopeptidase [Cellulomonas sp.]
MARKPRIAVAGLATETSMYSPGSTVGADFFPLTGQRVFEQVDYLAPGTPRGERAEWLPTLVGRAIPGPTVAREDYDRLRDTTLDLLRGLDDLDGVYLELHGAMHVAGLDDAEADLVHAIRAVVGPDVLLSAALDLHGNVSSRLVHALDLITCYRMAPHEDTDETRLRAVDNLLDQLAAGTRPVKAWVPVPVLLPGEQTSTRVEPARSLYARVPEVEALDGILDASVWIGYAWADEPRCHATVVVTGADQDLVAAQAEGLARAFWDVRDEFAFVGPTASFDDALAHVARPGGARPFFLSDSGDNPTAGGAGDATYALSRILAHADLLHGLDVVYASIPDEAGALAAAQAGVGGRVRIEVGARTDAVHHGPVLLDGTVTALHEDPRHGAGMQAVVRVGTVSVIVTQRRKPFHLERDFTELGLDPRSADVVVVKIGYLEPELHDMAADWILTLTPGGVDQDLPRLGHHAIARPMFPFDRGFEPDLRARLVPAPGEPYPDPQA